PGGGAGRDVGGFDDVLRGIAAGGPQRRCRYARAAAGRGRAAVIRAYRREILPPAPAQKGRRNACSVNRAICEPVGAFAERQQTERGGRKRPRYWMTMRGGWRRVSPSRAETLSQTRAAMAWYVLACSLSGCETARGRPPSEVSRMAMSSGTSPRNSV